jgi:hypothetical protein
VAWAIPVGNTRIQNSVEVAATDPVPKNIPGGPLKIVDG